MVIFLQIRRPRLGDHIYANSPELSVRFNILCMLYDFKNMLHEFSHEPILEMSYAQSWTTPLIIGTRTENGHEP